MDHAANADSLSHELIEFRIDEGLRVSHEIPPSASRALPLTAALGAGTVKVPDHGSRVGFARSLMSTLVSNRFDDPGYFSVHFADNQNQVGALFSAEQQANDKIREFREESTWPNSI
jgi:hypothetical protein